MSHPPHQTGHGNHWPPQRDPDCQRGTLLGSGRTVTREWQASPAAAGLARDQVTNALHRWGHASLISNATLVIAELVANAIEASSRLDTVRAHVGLQPGELVVAVWDCSDRQPNARHVDLSLETLDLRKESWDDNGGWGLTIVQSLATRCWIEPTPPRGKWICASLERE